MIQQVHQRLVAIAQEKKVVRGRRLRLDTTVVEKNIHYPTDSSLLGDGARVLTRTMRKITELTGRAGTKLRNRMRTRASVEDCNGPAAARGRKFRETKQGYRKLLTTTRKVVNEEMLPERDGQRCSAETTTRDWFWKRCGKIWKRMSPRCNKYPAKQGSRAGWRRPRSGKLVSVAEPSTE